MKKKFAVAASPITEAESREISTLFKGRYSWWHWIDDFWLVTDSTGKLKASSIRDQINDIAPDARVMVVEVRGYAWAGHGPGGGKKNMFTWMRENWNE